VKYTTSPFFPLLLLASSYLLVGCSASAPEYHTPEVQTPVAFSGYQHWQAIDKITPPTPNTQWWQSFHDPLLNQLVTSLTVNNQTLKANEAQYRAALATLDSSKAARYPTLSTTASATNGVLSSSSSFSSSSLPTNSSYSLNASASWELDLWGRIRQIVESNEAKAQASLADLYAARLSSQVLLVQTYCQLRNTDQQITLVQTSIDAYQRFVNLTAARKKAGVASGLDVAQAQTQLNTTQAQLFDLREQRSHQEHAIAALLGKPATGFSLAPQAAFETVLPTAPQLIPSTLLLNRPDIIANERRVAAANAQIGVAQAAYFPTINLVSSVGYRNTNLSDLINIPNTIWSLGPSLAYTLFDGGIREANVRIAEAGLDQAAATYKQTVLTAFQEVEDNLSSVSILAQEAQVQQQALDAASQALRIAQSQYKAGINSALNVITAQTAELTAKRSLASVQLRQQLANLILLKNSGGSS
jgi:NodT family efflux transporter outer membrane factor (OMF) lipoprotein